MTTKKHTIMNNTMMDFTHCKITNDLVLCNTSLFCSSGFDKECNTKSCPKVNKCQQQKFKKQQSCQQGKQNLIYLTNWPFIHPPIVTTNSTKMLIIKPPPFDDDQTQQQQQQQRQWCTCLNAISYTKQITTSYSFPSHQHNNNMSEKQQQ